MGIKSRSSGANIGEIKAYAGATIPAGWLACGGQAVSRTTYAALFLAVGTLYGVGDGATTFNLPDLRGRSLFGKDDLGGSAANRLTTGGGGVNGVVLGAVGGGQSVTLTAAEMPSHAHIQNAHDHGQVGANSTVTNATYRNYVQNNMGSSLGILIAAERTQATTPTEQTQGSSGAHANIPPAIVTNYIIKA